MVNEFVFNLYNMAKGSGGDRYSCIFNNREWHVYFPQEISRPKGIPVMQLTMTVKSEEDDNG